MLYPLLTFFVLYFFFESYLISFVASFIVFLIVNTKIINNDCGCDTEKKPQIDK
jgi:hypothetical protein